MHVKPEWIDYNGHLNMAYYNVLFDTAAVEMFNLFGFGPDYRATRKHTTFSAEFHVCYVREIHEGDPVYVLSQLVNYDAKRIHFYQELFHADGWLSATGEGLGLHIDMSGPKVAPMGDDILANIEALAQDHRQLPLPERVGRGISIPGGRMNRTRGALG
jgi:acyl-CoA thioester hydrolase